MNSDWTSCLYLETIKGHSHKMIIFYLYKICPFCMGTDGNMISKICMLFLAASVKLITNSENPQ